MIHILFYPFWILLIWLPHITHPRLERVDHYDPLQQLASSDSTRWKLDSFEKNAQKNAERNSRSTNHSIQVTKQTIIDKFWPCRMWMKIMKLSKQRSKETLNNSRIWGFPTDCLMDHVASPHAAGVVATSGIDLPPGPGDIGSLKVYQYIMDYHGQEYAVTWVTCIICLYILKTICVTSSLSHKSSRCKNNFLLQRRSHFLFLRLTRAQAIRRIANSVDVIQGCGLTVLTTSKGYISCEWKWYIYTLYSVSFVSLSFIIPKIFLTYYWHIQNRIITNHTNSSPSLRSSTWFTFTSNFSTPQRHYRQLLTTSRGENTVPAKLLEVRALTWPSPLLWLHPDKFQLHMLDMCWPRKK